MTFLEVVKKAKELIKLIDKYDDVAKQVITAMLFLFPADTQAVIKKILSIETSILLFLVNAIGEAEATKLAGAEKKEIVTKKILDAKIVKEPVRISDLIETSVTFVKTFVK